jgi:opacity protein-like surface antigen
MKRFLAAGLLVLAIMPAAVTAAVRAPAVQVSTSSPFVVKGSHFKRSELVRVVVVFKAHEHVRTVKATRKGAFTARFLRYSVRAKGNKGSRAFTRRDPECLGG